ncbi:MAG: hypothetical protein EZS28_005551 [Streblomastix strix]|uniref:Uncharacterized protein n=1 Tax=Streblomastix strix TaxID=222440 RepID=A0A5J4WVH4_9EUKA|nr:MAG: hypothetical protein EZS28_005551 [Streblomastix strix]
MLSHNSKKKLLLNKQTRFNNRFRSKPLDAKRSLCSQGAEVQFLKKLQHLTHQEYQCSEALRRQNGELRMFDVVLNHDQTLYSSSNKAPQPYNREEIDEMPDEKLNLSKQIDAQSNTEDNTLLALIADKIELINAYSKTETEALLEDELNITDQIDAYTKAQNDELLAVKLNISDKIDAYNQQEDDGLPLMKAETTELAQYVDLQSAQTIIGTKQFENISEFSKSKLSKNNASVLLVGGGDMLDSTLVSKLQLLEVRDIAIDWSKGYILSTQGELNDWMAVPDNVALLTIRDNLCIVDSQITDYWLYGTQLKELETQQPDKSNIVSSL